MSDQNREEQPESIPTPDPVVDSAFDAIPGASAASAEQNSPIVPPAPSTSAPDASPATDGSQPTQPSASPVPPPTPPAPTQAYPGGQPPQGHPGAQPQGGYPAPPAAGYPPAANGYPGNGYPGAAPGQQPYPGAAYPAQPYAAPPAGVTRPRFVVSACVLAWVIAALGAIGLIAALSLLAGYNINGGYLAGYLIVPILTIIGLVVFAIFTWQGRGWARIALTVMFALNAISGLASIGNGQPNALFGVLLSILGIVLLWLRPSNAWFAAKRASA